ncbi:hypothetical protein ACIRLA_33730 [Streptomyces sp. NPDC102364]|uniref:hypothetical protein n=1 Tax=Streptomyces sp. NPDC102364 TaxID=3366161 RepID=UPI0038294066
MAASAVPGAIAALLTILGALSRLADVDVLDEPPVVDVASQDFIATGRAPDCDQAVEFTQDFNSVGARSRDEAFSITCGIDVFVGDLDVAAVRARVFEVLGLVEDALRATGPNPTAPTLNGAVLWAHLTRGVLRQFNTDQGVRAGLGFTVTCQARI